MVDQLVCCDELAYSHPLCRSFPLVCIYGLPLLMLVLYCNVLYNSWHLVSDAPDALV